jgi:flagellar FliJ protein
MWIMAKLDSLIRLQKHHLDEKQKTLATLNDMLTGLENDQKALDAEREKEVELARHDVTLSRTLGGYLEGCEIREENIAKAMNNVNQQISVARDEIRDAFAELKKYEIVQKRRVEEERKALLKKENDTLDEIALDRHQRDSQ